MIGHHHLGWQFYSFETVFIVSFSPGKCCPTGLYDRSKWTKLQLGESYLVFSLAFLCATEELLCEEDQHCIQTLNAHVFIWFFFTYEGWNSTWVTALRYLLQLPEFKDGILQIQALYSHLLIQHSLPQKLWERRTGLDFFEEEEKPSWCSQLVFSQSQLSGSEIYTLQNLLHFCGYCFDFLKAKEFLLLI